jgi:hypothetical protein
MRTGAIYGGGYTKGRPGHGPGAAVLATEALMTGRRENDNDSVRQRAMQFIGCCRVRGDSVIRKHNV